MRKLLALAIAGFVAVSASSAMAADAGAGEKYVKKKCRACHTWDEGGKNKVGPNLFGVYGRKCGSVEGYKYSKGYKAACEAAGFQFDTASMTEYLADPSAYLKSQGGGKSKMTYKSKKEKDVVNTIEFLKTLK